MNRNKLLSIKKKVGNSHSFKKFLKAKEDENSNEVKKKKIFGEATGRIKFTLNISEKWERTKVQ